MKSIKFFCMILICAISPIVNSQNLLDTSTWTIGSGSVTGFSQYGSASENVREYGTIHNGDNEILWKAVNDNGVGPDGGWDSSYLSIPYAYYGTYRFTVWLKKTNSNNGASFFGCGTTNQNIRNLDNSINTSPFFWTGDLPKLNKWYLLVGYVHKYSYSSTVNLGGIYDRETGKKVIGITDFKMTYGTLNLMHRAYLGYDSNTSDRQYFYAPRIEKVTGSEPTIYGLMDITINENSKLIFAYDNAGNQKQRFYCPDSANCSVPTPPAGKSTKEENNIVQEDEIGTDEPINIINQLKISPNPTKDIVNIKLQSELLDKTASIKIYNINSSLIETLQINTSNQDFKVDLTGRPSGVYFLHIHLNDGSKGVTKRIVKE